MIAFTAAGEATLEIFRSTGRLRLAPAKDDPDERLQRPRFDMGNTTRRGHHVRVLRRRQRSRGVRADRRDPHGEASPVAETDARLDRELRAAAREDEVTATTRRLLTARGPGEP